MDTRPLLVQQNNNFGAPKVVPPLNAPRVVQPINPPVVHAPLSGQSHFQEPEQYDGPTAGDYAAVAGLAVVGLAAWGVQKAMEQGEYTDNSPSTAVDHATWDSHSMMITIHTHSGRTYEYPCDPATWEAYTSSISKGSFLNETWWA